MSINQLALPGGKGGYKMVDDRWQIRRYSNFIQSCRVVLILRQISHICPGKGSLFLLPVRRIHGPSTPPHRSSYASSKVPCPNTATPPSSAVHASPVRPLPPPRSYGRRPSYRHRHVRVRASVVFHPDLMGPAHVQHWHAVAERDFRAVVEGVGPMHSKSAKRSRTSAEGAR